MPEKIESIKNVDSAPTEGSDNLVTSNGVYEAINSVNDNIESSINAIKDELSSDMSDLNTNINELTESLDENTTQINDILTDYATKDYVNKEISNISIPESGLNESEVKTIIEGYNYLAEGSSLLTINGEEWIQGGNYTIDVGESEVSIEDSLNSQSTTSALSANQGYILNNKISDLNSNISSLPNGVNVLSTSGGTVSLESLTATNPFGVVIVPHGTEVTFSNSNVLNMVNSDTSDGAYDVYCVMYANDNYFVNMSVYN